MSVLWHNLTKYGITGRRDTGAPKGVLACDSPTLDPLPRASPVSRIWISLSHATSPIYTQLVLYLQAVPLRFHSWHLSDGGQHTLAHDGTDRVAP